MMAEATSRRSKNLSEESSSCGSARNWSRSIAWSSRSVVSSEASRITLIKFSSSSSSILDSDVRKAVKSSRALELPPLDLPPFAVRLLGTRSEWRRRSVPLLIRSADRALAAELYSFSSAELFENEGAWWITSVPAIPRIRPEIKIRMLVFIVRKSLFE